MRNERVVDFDELEKEFVWLKESISTRLNNHFASDGPVLSDLPNPPDLSGSNSAYASLLKALDLNESMRLVLVMSLAPHLKPGALDLFFLRNEANNRGFSEFGGISGTHHSGFLPTLETALFLLAGDDLVSRQRAQSVLAEDCVLRTERLLELTEKLAHNDPDLSAALTPSNEILHFIRTGRSSFEPKFSESFPAKRETTELQWEDLILPSATITQLETILHWSQQGETILSKFGLNRLFKPGYHALFYGLPGTGKSLAAKLLAKKLSRSLFRVDLASVVSKYIGETEKNLAKLFDSAEKRNWLLFFDEADALFGDRSTNASGANDRYANLQVSYLLQRVENFSGTLILASNLKDNIDDAFARRLQSIVYFPRPDPQLRKQHWQKIGDYQFTLDEAIDLDVLAQQHDLTGGQIVNVLQYAVLQAEVNNTGQVLALNDLVFGIEQELAKDGIR